MSQLKKLIIYVEGKDDLSFFAEFIEDNFPSSGIKRDNTNPYAFTNKDKFEQRSQLIEYGGDNFKNEISQIEYWINDGYDIIVIADCDKSKADKEEHYNEIKKKYSIEFKLHLLGDENGKGAIERIMQQCIEEEFIPLSECFHDFNKCLKSKGKDYKAYVVPHPFNNVKTYFDKFKEIAIKGNKNPKIFNYNHPSLEALKTFLSTYFE